MESTCQTTGWDAEAVAAMQWWDEAAGVVVDDLPRDKRVWHYHPATALRALLAEAQRTAPVFYVEREEEKRRVERPDDIQMPGPDERLGEAVSVRDDAGDRVFAHGYERGPYQGLYRNEGPDLYEMLIAPASTEGVPREDLSTFERNVWASLSESEGSLRSINTYDSAFLSVGPLQQTAGASDFRGELFGAMATVRDEAPDVFDEYIGQYRLAIHEPRMELDARKAYAKIGDEILNNAQCKEQLRAFSWAYRFASAFDDPEFRKPMLREGFQRIANLQDLDVTLSVTTDGTETEVETTVGDLFQRDLAMALLLDTHVNAPAIVWPGSDANVWEESYQRRFSDWNVTDVEDLSRKQEMILTANLIQARIGAEERMSNPEERTFKILKYTNPKTVKYMAKSNTEDALYEGVPDYLSSLFGWCRETAHSNWDTIRQSGHQTLSFAKYDD